MKRSTVISAFRAASFIAALAVFPAHAKDKIKYPVPTVTLVTQSSPGGGGDVFLRQLAATLSKYTDTVFIVQNVVGGGGAKAMAYVAKSPPDGSVFYGTTPTYINTSLISKTEVNYSHLESVVNFFIDPMVLYVSGKSPFKNLTDIVAEAKKRPGKVRVSVGDAAAMDPQVVQRLETLGGIKLVIVPFDGGGESMMSVMNGTGEIGVGEMAELRGQIEAGEIRPVAALTTARLGQFPDIPTAKEQGLDIVINKFRALVGPKGISPEAVAAWEKLVPILLEDPDLKSWYSQSAMIPTYLPHKESAKFIEDFVAEQKAYLTQNNIIK